ncbi:kinase-associated lipoprotein B [Alkalihalophilus marmarensis]|uniref:Kinase n=1 Tax=Alkalihalophilus marmarensis DSM 21297 TaxID=1188261 RepID=U6SSA9_9BACI|nr:kinase-associated lipoprotein B [Alkalihalophilus marmarensis]ERN54262.1 kinase [Alkalihalophilus marmarensis DSM 21297]
MSIVQAKYKTGVYIGEVVEMRESEQRGLIKVLAVLKHPTQGDLHNPKQTEGVFFHQRKALAEFEKTWVPLATIKPYEGDVPSYSDSLRSALEEKIDELMHKQSEFSNQSLKHLQELKDEYGL